MSDESLVSLGGATWRDEEDSEAAASEATASETAASETAASDEDNDPDVYGPGDDESQWPTEGLSPVNIRNFSVKCGHCGNYQVIVAFRPVDEEWNEYVYECDQPPCAGDVERSRTVLEIPSALDEYSRRDPNWHGGEVHAGAKHGSEE